MSKNGVTFEDVKRHYIDRILDSQYVGTRKQAEELLLDAMCRKISVANILEVCGVIANDSEDELK